MTGFKFAIILVLLGIPAVAVAATGIDLRGQAAISLVAGDTEPRFVRADLRYQSDLTLVFPLGGFRDLSVFASAEALHRSRITSFDQAVSDGELSLFRAGLRYAGSRTELRLGRQKLSFGSATLLRPLMWFDSIDPRDPLQLTKGVDGLLGRVFLASNANIWLWGLYGSDRPKGWEVFGTPEEDIEYGGRVQWPLGNGEIAGTYHHRLADMEALRNPLVPGVFPPAARENRYALDGKWDVTIGLWFEAVVVHQSHPALRQPYQSFLATGTDYTFPVGQGLTVLAEHLVIRSGERLFGGSGGDFSAVSLRYPLGVVDELGLIVDYDWLAADLYSFLEWRRTYDRWSFHLMGFNNPSDAASSPLPQEGGLLAGRGGRFLVSFNH